MSDIVERLRDTAKYGEGHLVRHCLEAAAEIERLRAVIVRIDRCAKSVQKDKKSENPNEINDR